MAPLPSFPRSTGQPLVEAVHTAALVGHRLRIAENPAGGWRKHAPAGRENLKTRGGRGGAAVGGPVKIHENSKGLSVYRTSITQKKKWKNPNECISV